MSTDLQIIQRKKRDLKRSLLKIKESVTEWAKQTHSYKLIDKIEAALQEFTDERREFLVLYDRELEIIYSSELEKSALDKELKSIEKEKDEIRDVWISLSGTLCNIKRGVSDSTSRQSIVTEHLNQSFSANSLPKLPRIKVPEFNGDIRNFISFKNLFRNLIHDNPDLNNVQKLYFLKNALIDEASQLIRDFEVTDQSYTEAWSLLLSRYENRRSIVKTHFRDLISLTPLSNESGIRGLLDNVNGIVKGIKICGINEDMFQSFLAYFISTKLDPSTLRDWENSITDNSKYPLYADLEKFLQNRSFNVETRSIETNANDTSSKSNSKKPSPSKAPERSSPIDRKKSFATGKVKCCVCDKFHVISVCPDFLSKNPSDRYQIVKTNNLCTNCFSSSHHNTDCKSSMCKRCNHKHHTLLHREISPKRNESTSDATKPKSTESNGSSESRSSNSKSSCVSVNQNRSIILPTAVACIIIKSKSGYSQRINARILLDVGSQTNLISEQFVRKHRIRTFKNREPYILNGVTESSISIKFSTNLCLRSRINDFTIQMEADVVPSLPYEVLDDQIQTIREANRSLNFGECKLPYNSVDILLGAEHYEKCVFDHSLKSETVFLRNTNFGWVISGPMVSIEKGSNTRSCNIATVAIEDQLQKFWQLEEVSSSELKISEHERCEEFIEKSTYRNSSGRFVVRLPFRLDRSKIGESYQGALSALKRVESSIDPATRDLYVSFMKEYEDLGHMSLVSINQPEPQHVYYIPHRHVLRPESTTTQLRVVFNASARSKSKLSLNDILMKGPSLQPELFDTLIRFRDHTIAFSADISKMYRQIEVHDQDRDMQRILWRTDPRSPIRKYRLKTVTYGTAPASYLATKCLSILSNEISAVDPAGSQAIASDFYMDDLLTGAPSVKAAITLQQSIHETLSSALLPLRKYMSNSPEFLSSIDPSLIEPLKSVEFCDHEIVSILGLCWNPTEDLFSAKLNLKNLTAKEIISKRLILSEIARVFDPLGILSPVTIRAKIILQKVWREQRSWDEPVSNDLSEEFRAYYKELSSLRSFSLPRRLTVFDVADARHLVGFCDASEKAYCATVYLRTFDPTGRVSCHLICAKTRVSPLKELTIPRLELQAALLLSQLLDRVAKDLKIDHKNIFAFSDSTIVLCWLRNVPEKWTVFVANRVRKIIESYPSDHWYHVHTKENPADLGTRGLPVKSFLNDQLWLYGPAFLYTPMAFETYPKIEPEKMPEIRRIKTAFNLVVNTSFLTNLIENHSDYNKLINVISLVLRFVNLCKNSIKTKNGIESIFLKTNVVTVYEQSLALNVIVKFLQSLKYQPEIECIRNNLPLKKTSSLIALTPFLDQNGILRIGILRIGGRLRNSQLSYDRRHPIILHVKSPFVELLINHLHHQYFHAGKTFIVNLLSNRFWFTGGIGPLVKKLINRCVTCIRYKRQAAGQIMGQLPADRVTVDRPFNIVGVDLAGPFRCKCTGHRSAKINKVYAAIFVCFVVKAVHIEILTSLSTESFLLCLQRFVARRGIPSRIYSDNATNFVGTNNMLSFCDPKLQREASSKQIQWSFIPPRSPHRGGLWEASVKSAKYHLTRVMKDQALDLEEFGTLFSRIESILNSRPLCYRKEERTALTPAHFLVGSSILSPSSAEPTSSNVSLSRRYDLIRQQIQSFWIHWSRDYLNQLQLRAKWRTHHRNLTIGDIVLLKDDLSKPSNWSLGIIESVFPDEEGVVRTAEVRTEGSLKKRAVQTLILLLSEETGVPSAGGNMFGSNAPTAQREPDSR